MIWRWKLDIIFTVSRIKTPITCERGKSDNGVQFPQVFLGEVVTHVDLQEQELKGQKGLLEDEPQLLGQELGVVQTRDQDKLKDVLLDVHEENNGCHDGACWYGIVSWKGELLHSLIDPGQVHCYNV